MVHLAGEHVRDRLDAAVRMPREAREVVGRSVVSEVVEQQERIGLGRFAEAEGAAQLDAGAFQRGAGLADAFDGADGHDSRSRKGRERCTWGR